MSSSIDKKIVALELDDSKFASKAQAALDILGQLGKDDLETPRKGLAGLWDKIKEIPLGNLETPLGKISGSFSALSVIGATALGKLTTSAVAFGQSMLQNVIDPIVNGGRNRALALEKARFQFDNLGLDVADVMGAVSASVDGTAYSLQDAATAAAQFAAMGRSTGQTLTPVLKSIVGVAAQSGAEFTQVTDIFAKIQGQGRVMGDDLNRLGTLGIAAAAELAKSFGVTEGEMRKMVSEGKIGIDDLITAFQKFEEGAGKANDTYTGSLANMKSSFSRIGALWFEGKYNLDGTAQFVGHLERQRNIFNAIRPLVNDINTAITPTMKLINDVATAGNARLTGFLHGLATKDKEGNVKEGETFMGSFIQGMTSMAGGLTNIYNLVMAVINPLREAIGQIIPKGNMMAGFAALMAGFEKFTATLSLTETGVANVSTVIHSLLSPFKLVSSAIQFLGDGISGAFKGLVDGIQIGDTSLGEWFRNLQSNGGSFVNQVVAIIGKFGEFMDMVRGKIDGVDSFQFMYDSALKVGDGIDWLIVKGEELIAFFKGLNLGQYFDDAMASLEGPINEIVAAFQIAKEGLGGIALGGVAAAGESLDGLGSVVDSIKDKFASMKTAVSNWWDNIEWAKVGEGIAAVWDGLVSTIDRVKSNIANVRDTIKDLFSGITGGLQSVFGELDPNLVAGGLNLGAFMVAATTVKKIIDGFREASEGHDLLGGVTEAIGSLSGTLQAMSMDIKAGAILKIAAAIGVLALSLVVLTLVDASKLLASSIALVAIMAAMAGMLYVLDGMKLDSLTKIPVLAASLLLLGGAVLLMSIAAVKMGELEWEELARGLIGITGILAALNIGQKGAADAVAMLVLAFAISKLVDAVTLLGQVEWEAVAKSAIVIGGLVGAIKLLDKMDLNSADLIKTAISIGIFAISLSLMAGAITLLAAVPLDTMVSGLIRMAVVLGMVTAAFNLMPKGNKMLKAATAIGILAVSIAILVPPIVALSLIPIENLIQGLLGLGLTMAILVVSMNSLAASGPTGMAAMLVMALAVGILVPQLIALSLVPWQGLLIGIGILALAFGLFAGAAILLTPVLPAMLALGIAVAAIGAGVALAGLGVQAFAMGLATLAVSGLAAIPAIRGLIEAFIEMIPLIATLALGIITGIAEAIAAAAPAILTAFVAILTALVDAIIEVAPVIIEGILTLLEMLLEAIVEAVPMIYDAGLRLITGLLDALAANIDPIITSATNLIVAFVEGLTKSVKKVVPAVTELIVTFINEVSNNSEKILTAGKDAIVKFIEGLGQKASDITAAASKAVNQFADAVATAVENSSAAMQSAGRRIGIAIADGMTGGLASKVGSVVEKAKSLASSAINGAKGLLGIASPSKVFTEIGQFVGVGMANGMDNKASSVASSAKSMGNSAVQGVREALGNISDEMAMNSDFNPTITPVLDLTEVNRQIPNLSGLLDLDAVYSGSSEVSLDGIDGSSLGRGVTTVNNFEYSQTNVSPKALSVVDVYRQTNNQLSRIKEGFTNGTD